MTKSKHTPGPWKAVSVGKHTATMKILAAAVGSKTHLDYSVVKEVYKPANAQLIAAAPDMLDALEKVIDIFNYDDVFLIMEKLDPWLRNVEPLLKKLKQGNKS